MSRFRVIPRAETKLTRQEMYDIIRSPVITEKATCGVGAQPGDLPRPARPRPSARSRRRSKALFKVKVDAVNTIRVQGKTKRFRGRAGPPLRLKKAIVTLAEGQTDRRDHRDIGRGILGRWHSKLTTRPRRRSGIW